jgi:predicted ATPase/DNA-binding winged helix-turn-helix (wHTH) protein
MQVQIFLFGRFEVCREGHPLPPEAWKNTKTLSLLKILAGDRGRVFSADELIEYLWPSEELDLKSASSNLRNRVADLRKILEPALARGEQSHYILTQRGGYALSSESDCWVDAEEFSRLEEIGRRQQRERRLDEAINAFEKAVALYRGDYLAEDRYDDWALQSQERWRERFVEILSLLADCLARRGQYRAAIGHLERALTRSVLHETLYRQLMIYAFCAGEMARAHRAYEQCRAALERELGERPSSQTEEIYKQVKAGKIPDLEKLYPEPVPEQFLSSLPQKIQRPPFVGRQNEWGQLTSALNKARSGEGRIVLICGEAGVGKTRLSEEFLVWSQEKVGAHALVGRCYELENPLPLHPWLEALREGIPRLNFADLADLQPLWVAELSEILPELKRVIPNLPVAISLPPEHRQYRLFETLYRMVSSLALRQAPIVFLLDDLQWADAGSLDFLCYIIERLAKEPLLILGTLRSEEVPREHHLGRLRHQGSRFGRLDEVHLTRLGEQEIQDLVKSLADELEMTTDFGGRLYHESVGNPLFATAVLQALFENGAFVHEGNRWRLTDLSSLRLSSQAVGLIERRVTRVSAAAQRVLQLVACAVQIELEVLEEAWEGTPEELFVHLTELVAQGLLAERLGRYEFAHDKFREVVYESLEGPRQIWLHRRIAQAMEQVYPDPAAAGFAGRLAQHYELGGQPLQALEWVLKAVQDHQKHYQHKEGLAVITKGFNLLQAVAARLPKLKQQEFEYQLLESRINLYLHLGQLTEAEPDLLRLGELAERDPCHQARVHLLRADWYERLGKYSEELAEAQQALALYQYANDRQGEVRALREHSLARYYLGNSVAAIEGFQKLLSAAEDPEDVMGQEIVTRAQHPIGRDSIQHNRRQHRKFLGHLHP